MALTNSWFYNSETPLHLAQDYSGFYSHKSHFDKSTPNNIASYFPFLLSLGVLGSETQAQIQQPTTILNDNDNNIKERNVYERSGPLKTLFRWKVIDFAYDKEEDRMAAKKSKEFMQQNNLPLGIEVYKDRMFISFPKWKGGVPVTLGYIPMDSGEESPNIIPYPDWNWQKTGSCYTFTSVYRMQADVCGRLWVLDSGQIDVAVNPKQVCPPVIYVFDLKTDKLLLRYEMPKDFVRQDSLFSNIVIDVNKNDCGNAHAYVTDVWRFGLVVYSMKNGKSWRLFDHLFYPDPLAAAYQLNGLDWEWTDGVFGIALSPHREDTKDRILYYHPMSSFREFYSYASIVQNETGWMNVKDAFRVLGESRGKRGQASASAMDRNGILFFNLVTRSSIGCWDSSKVYKKSNLGIIAYDNDTIIFPNDLKIDNEDRQSLWILSNRLPDFVYRSLNYNEYNFRIMTSYIDEAIGDGICNPKFSYEDSYEHNYDECD